MKSRRKNTQLNRIQRAIDYGIDIEMLKTNLKRSVAKRISHHQAALNLVRLFQKAKKI